MMALLLFGTFLGLLSHSTIGQVIGILMFALGLVVAAMAPYFEIEDNHAAEDQRPQVPSS